MIFYTLTEFLRINSTSIFSKFAKFPKSCNLPFYRRYSCNRKLLSKNDHEANAFAFRIVKCIVGLFTPYMVITSLPLFVSNQMRQTTVFAFISLFSYSLIFLNSLFTALLFMWTNTGCKEVSEVVKSPSLVSCSLACHSPLFEDSVKLKTCYQTTSKSLDTNVTSVTEN